MAYATAEDCLKHCTDDTVNTLREIYSWKSLLVR